MAKGAVLPKEALTVMERIGTFWLIVSECGETIDSSFPFCLRLQRWKAHKLVLKGKSHLMVSRAFFPRHMGNTWLHLYMRSFPYGMETFLWLYDSGSSSLRYHVFFYSPAFLVVIVFVKCCSITFGYFSPLGLLRSLITKSLDPPFPDEKGRKKQAEQNDSADHGDDT